LNSVTLAAVFLNEAGVTDASTVVDAVALILTDQRAAHTHRQVCGK